MLALAGGLSVAIGYKTRWGAWALVAFLVPVTLWMHAYWRLSDPHTAFIEQVLFLKNLSMLGAALLISQFGAGPISIDQPRYRVDAARQWPIRWKGLDSETRGVSP